MAARRLLLSQERCGLGEEKERECALKEKESAGGRQENRKETEEQRVGRRSCREVHWPFVVSMAGK